MLEIQRRTDAFSAELGSTRQRPGAPRLPIALTASLGHTWTPKATTQLLIALHVQQGPIKM
eukprot:SAG31_NODE_34956_length_327_cov_1.280702_1_plen_60_part_10